MLFTTVSSLAALALASQAAAEPLRQPYKLKLSRMPVNSLFGLSRRQSEGYSPEQQFCGAGDTCAEACGKGFEQCSSNDGTVHCFNEAAKQTCCPGLTGDSCDKGYFCSADEKGATWCCPDNMTLEQCAAAYNLPGSLVSEMPPTTTPTKSSASTPAATPTNDTTIRVVVTTTKAFVPETTSDTQAVVSTPSTTPPASTTIAIPITTPTSSSPASTTSVTAPENGIVQAGSNNVHVPVGGMVLLGAAAFAALL
ncbi:hypothetical protein F4818DRAFT_362433 [Hypoxylon cercidicola]|nr:hypothetical protein F4818DRAFT_362433 [Hypoxylon cercidicola]